MTANEQKRFNELFRAWEERGQIIQQLAGGDINTLTTIEASRKLLEVCRFLSSLKYIQWRHSGLVRKIQELSLLISPEKPSP